MLQRSFVILPVLGVLLAAGPPRAGAGPSLRPVLEKAWKAYLAAGKSGKPSELEKTMSSFRFGTMKNQLAAVKRSLTPEFIRSIAENAPDVSKADFVTLLEKGSTAGLVYVADSEEKDDGGKPRITFIFIKFLNEGSGWKVDGAMNIGSPKFRDDGRRMEFDPADLPPTYEIDGQVRAAPQSVSSPYASAFLDVFCPGYRIQVTVNGREQATTVDQSHSGLIDGGLRKGENNIVIVVYPLKKDAAFKPRVKVRRVLEDRSMVEVFKFEPQKNIGGRHGYTFRVD